MKFIVYVPPFKNYNSDYMQAWEKILECEGKKLHILPATKDDSRKCMTLGNCSGLPILVVENNGVETYIGTHYIDLINYLSDNGLILC